MKTRNKMKSGSRSNHIKEFDADKLREEFVINFFRPGDTRAANLKIQFEGRALFENL